MSDPRTARAPHLCRDRTRPGYQRIPGSFGRSVGKADLPSGALFMNTPGGFWEDIGICRPTGRRLPSEGEPSAGGGALKEKKNKTGET